MKPSFRGGGIFISMNKHRGKSMKKKTKTITIGIIISVFLIGIVSAGLVGYLSNMITATVTVEGPVFYLNGDYSNEDLEYYSLLLNEFIKGNKLKVSFSDGLESEWFVSKELGINSFYSADYNFNVEICAKNKTEDEDFGQVILSLKILKENGDFRGPICEAYIENIPTTTSCVYDNRDYHIYPATCSAKELELEPTDKFVLIISDGAHAIIYYIRLDGDTKFEITT